MKKSSVKSKTLWLNLSGAIYFAVDALEQFVASGGIDDVCAKKSAVAAGIMFLTSAIRKWFTYQPLGKEGFSDDRIIGGPRS